MSANPVDQTRRAAVTVKPGGLPSRTTITSPSLPSAARCRPVVDGPGTLHALCSHTGPAPRHQARRLQPTERAGAARDAAAAALRGAEGA
ncbi:hypothetical protein AB0H73_38590 [Streptomyces olivoreticuli]